MQEYQVNVEFLNISCVVMMGASRGCGSGYVCEVTLHGGTCGSRECEGWYRMSVHE